ncbi:MAG: tetratricopeptide repeat protein [Candidatus Omnitrophica bacterium]|nr:tetratricopeptide repeat protein [Candidatus Omnitrophota bacterium]MBU1932828.1 tetratricopeptide repeat protein [Candidatus Omnitrophota bacterium]
MSLCPCVLAALYAQEQNIAESFGLYGRGVDYYHAGKLHEAKSILERALKVDPMNDDAQGYLDLVNAELNMRARGKLDFYQDENNLKRESDFNESRVYAEIEPYEPDTNTYEDSYEYKDYRPGRIPEDPGYSEDKIKVVTDALNEKIAPGRIKGEYKMSVGVTTEDVIWKKANADYNERNFRMIDHNFPKTNTFDTRVYDRFKVTFDTNKDAEGFNLHSDITVDPWSFVGKTDKFTVTRNGGGDRVEMELKYWSGTRSTINEILYTLDTGASIATSEYKVSDGKMPSTTVSDLYGNTFTIPEKDIDFTFQPVRELWFDFNQEDYKFRVFPYGLEDQALSSDDPMGLSNHHIYWEPSPWLDEWKPGHINTGTTPDDFWRGEWSDDLTFFTRDSDLKRLTALRGVAFQGNLLGNTDMSMTVASPKGLWDDYGEVNAIPGAMRTKTQLTDSLMIGTIDTFRIGYDDDNNTDSYNNVLGVDASYDLNPSTNIVGQVAMSKSEYDRTSSYKTEKNGTAGHLAVKKETGLGNAKLAITHMDETFDPGLANYRETRKDMHWGRHIHFKKPLEQDAWGGTSLKYEDVEPFRIGDGVDIGRDAINFRLDSRDAFDSKMDNLIDCRYVRDSEHKYVEGVFREENTLRINPRWTSKLLYIYHDLPKTKGGIDPIQYDSDTGEFLKNTAIEDGNDPSLSTYSFGLEYAPEEWISLFGIYENTNDYRFGTGNHPNGLLNSTYFTTETIEGKVYRDEIAQLYSQGWFDLPPYDRFNIFRAGISLRPTEKLGIDFDYTKNDFKFASGIDDNINHIGTTLKYKFNPRLTGFLKYTFSKLYNMYRLNTTGDLKYENHHNVFMEFNCNVTEYGLLVIQFGEGSVVSPVWGATASPYGDFYPTLDTQHILRIYYHGIF